MRRAFRDNGVHAAVFCEAYRQGLPRRSSVPAHTISDIPVVVHAAVLCIGPVGKLPRVRRVLRTGYDPRPVTEPCIRRLIHQRPETNDPAQQGRAGTTKDTGTQVNGHEESGILRERAAAPGDTGGSKEQRFAQILAGNRDRIYLICCGYARVPDARKDIYQDVLMNLWRSLDSFQERSAPGTWVYRIALNTCLGHLRAEKRRTAKIDADVRVEDAADMTDTAGGDAADVARMYRCIHHLKDEEKAVIMLYLEDLDARAMAGVLGVSEGAVRVKLHRARKTLQELWERLPYGT